MMKFYIDRTALYIYNHFVNRIPSKFIRDFFYSKVFNIGCNSNIMLGFRIRSFGKMIIGNNVNINSNCLFDTRGGRIIIGNNVDIAPEVNIWTLEHDYNDPDFSTKGGEVIIEDYVWIANRCIILPGVKLGRNSVVASGSVVTKDVECNSIVGGIPAKLIGLRNCNQNFRKEYNAFLM